MLDSSSNEKIVIDFIFTHGNAAPDYLVIWDKTI